MVSEIDLPQLALTEDAVLAQVELTLSTSALDEQGIGAAAASRHGGGQLDRPRCRAGTADGPNTPVLRMRARTSAISSSSGRKTRRCL